MKVLLVLSVVLGVTFQQVFSTLEHSKVYRIISKEGDGTWVLTAPNANMTEPGTSMGVTLEKWESLAEQKWRFNKAWLHRAYEIKPTYQDEHYSLQIDAEGNVFQRWASKAWSWGNQRLWIVKDVGEGETESDFPSFNKIQNWHFGLCLTSHGLEHNLTAGLCNNDLNQQWQVEKL